MEPKSALQVAFPLNDAALVQRALASDAAAFRMIMERHNRRLYRIARSILGNDSEAEDALQEAYLQAFTHLAGFRGEASLGTWLARITMNEALERVRRTRAGITFEDKEARADSQIIPFPSASGDPERTMAQREILRLVEQAADNLPEIFRTVFMLRMIEGMSVEETANLLGIQPQTVKTRLHRARRLLKEELGRKIGPILLDAFPFAGRRCATLTDTVIRKLGLSG